jgi:glucosylceramidase
MALSSIKATVTDENGLLTSRPEVAVGSMQSRSVIEIDPAKEHQPILGFGAAFTDAACYNISQLPDPDRKSLLTELLGNDGMGFNVARTSVGQSDYGRVRYSYDDTVDDLDLKDFSLDYDRSYIIPTLLEARDIRPDLFLLSSPWSPPGWMKTSETMLGGWMREKYLDVYARYYVKYLQGYAEAGIKIDALTPQNEVETDQGGRMPACYWHPDIEVNFVRDHLGPLLRKNGIDIDIWLLDHNYDLWQRAAWMLKQEGMSEFSTSIAFHGYVGTADMMKKVTDAVPNAKLYWTEGGPAYNEPDYKNGWCRWAKTVTETMVNGCRCFIAWNFALDETGKPNIGPFDCGGLVTIDSKTQKITRSGQYYAMGQFSKFVPRGSVRVETAADIEDVHHVAFRNPDGGLVLVVTNPGNTRTVGLKCGKIAADLTLPANSVSTFTWLD